MLEASQHAVNSFWTLTYDDENLPHTENGLPTLVPNHLRDFLKRLRFDYYPEKLRYFNVGEYGEHTERPHYHLALFNYPACERGHTQPNRRGYCCSICDRVGGIWGSGLVYSGQLEAASAAYIAGYVTKKLTSKEDERLKGRCQEFARMSLKPGIGATFIPEVASAYLTHNLDSLQSDVPTTLRHGSSVQPLGRYLVRTLRAQTGMSPNAPASTIQAQKEKMLPLQEAARALAAPGNFTETLKSISLAANEGRYQQAIARYKRHKKKGYL